MEDTGPDPWEDSIFKEAIAKKAVGMRAFIARRTALSESVVLVKNGKYCERLVRCIGGDHIGRAKSYMDRYNAT